MKFKKITNHPVPIYAVECPPWSARRALAEELEDWCREWVPSSRKCFARGVELKCLPSILKHGCDVQPTDAPLFVAKLNKAIEYGANGDQLIQYFHQDHLRTTWIEKPSSIGEDEKEQLRKTYPTMVKSRDGKLLWFSRFSEGDKRIANDYEKYHGAWIPGDPFDALTCIIVLGAQLHDVVKYCVTALREARDLHASVNTFDVQQGGLSTQTPEPFKKSSAFLIQPKPSQNFADFKQRIKEQLRERGVMKDGEAEPQASISKEEPETEDDEEGIRSERLRRLRARQMSRAQQDHPPESPP